MAHWAEMISESRPAAYGATRGPTFGSTSLSNTLSRDSPDKRATSAYGCRCCETSSVRNRRHTGIQKYIINRNATGTPADAIYLVQIDQLDYRR